jgi:archaellum component FlaC
MMQGLSEMLETVRKTCPYDPKTPPEPGSAWEGEPDPFAKDWSPSSASPPQRVPDAETWSFEKLRQDTKELQRLGINGLFASRRKELADHNAKEFADYTDPVEPSPEQPSPPLRNPPAHRALVLEEIRQHARGESSTPLEAPASVGLDLTEPNPIPYLESLRSSFPYIYAAIQEAKAREVTVPVEPPSAGLDLTEPDPIPFLENLRLYKPSLYVSIQEAKAREVIVPVEPSNPPTRLQPPPPRFNTEGWLTTEEILAEIRKQLPPRPPSDSNSELSDDWPWDSPPSTSSRAVEEDSNVSSPRRILPRTPLSDWESRPSEPSKVLEEERNGPAPLPTPPSAPVIPPGFRADWIQQDPVVPQAPPLPGQLAGSVHRYIPPGVEGDPITHAALNREIHEFHKKKHAKMGLSPPSESRELDDSEMEERASESALTTPHAPDVDARRLIAVDQSIGAFGGKLGDLDLDVSRLNTRVDGFETQTLGMEKGLAALDGRTTMLENGVTSLNSRTHGFANDMTNLDLRTNSLENGFGSLTAGLKNVDIPGLNSRTKVLENGITSLNSRMAGVETGLGALESKTNGLENGILSLESRTAGFEKGIADLDGRTPNLEQSISRCGERTEVIVDATNKKFIGVDERLNDVEEKVNGLEEIHERSPELRKLLSDGNEIGDQLKNLNDGLQNAGVGIANLNEGFKRAANVLRNHAHHIDRVDNELVAHKSTEEQRQKDLVERVDGLRKGLTFLGVGAGVISATGFGLWAWSRVSKWLKLNKERKQLEPAARGDTGVGVGPSEMQRAGNSGLKRRSHVRNWNRFEI